MKELQAIQKKLKVSKSQYNSFGKYAYRSCEDILEAVKPLLGACILTISDEIVEVGGAVYVKATATITNDEGAAIATTAYAREPDARKGMDESQITGACSSYARKYALNGLFCIDDAKDADAQNTHGGKATKEQLAKIKSLAMKAGIDENEILDFCSIRAGKNFKNSGQITEADAQKIISQG
jgi:hypothetical protein